MAERPRGTLLRERNGDFNPGWLMACLVSVIGAIGCLVIFWRVYQAKTPGSELVLTGLAFSFLAFALVSWLTGVYSLGRVKQMHNSTVLTQLAANFDVDERDEEQRARGD